MKKIAFLSVFTAVLLLTGCASKQPTIDQTQAAQPAATQGAGATSAAQNVSSGDNSNVTSTTAQSTTADTNEMKMANLEKKLETIYFNFDKYNIRPDMKQKMQEDAKLVKASDENYTIKLEGNCDEWGSDEYNFALGLKRAETVKTHLINNGVDAKHITMISYGKTRPVCTEHTKACWQENRRVNFKVLP